MTTQDHVTAKQLARRALDHLPDDVSMPDVIGRLQFLHEIQLGLDDIDAGRIVSQDEAKRRMAK